MTMNEIALPVAERPLAARLQRPDAALGLVIFVHGSGVDRHDARDRRVAAELATAGLATLQPELLDAREAREPGKVLDAELHCARLLQALEWVGREAWAAKLPLGLFGSGIGAGAALLAASARPDRIAAVVCRDGRPDIALFRAGLVKAATLMLVEQDGWPYRDVYEALSVPKELVVVPAERPGFAEPAAMQQVAEHARRWFSRYLAA
jgi:dienelactone hydrolase